MPQKENKLTRLFARFSPKLFALIAMLAVALVPMIASAWGPARSTFTMEEPANYVTFNSITNNPKVGDERNFVVLRPAGTDGAWQDETTVTADGEYQVRLYVHNNAKAPLNLVATNTRATVALNGAAGKRSAITGYVSADNANPGKVWDDAALVSAKNFTMSYVPGSAKIYNAGFAGDAGVALPDSLFSTDGTLVGYNGLDGKVPGCSQYVSYIYFNVSVKTEIAANFEMDKKVRVVGATEWLDQTNAKPGDTLEYRIGYYNTGQATQNNVVVKDTLPKNVTYIPGSTILQNANHKDGVKVESDDIIKANGINIGNYEGGAKAYVFFKSKIADNKDLAVCGNNTLRNYGIVKTDNGSKEDSADTIVPKEDCGTSQKECKPGIPEGDERCAEVAGGTIPATGPGAAIAIVAVLALLGAGFAYWYTTTHQKKKAAKGQKVLVKKDETPKVEEKKDDFNDIHNH